MALIKKPETGMKDILPEEMEIRDFVSRTARQTYAAYGFEHIETPCVEHIENLSSSQGGENEKLIFKIMKRGEKLDLSAAKEENDLCDAGLRYDLTLPLARYYALHQAELLTPFKAFQMGSVFRAERPQKGRFRQFTQCDIDILGESGTMAEIELITATTELLSKIGFSGFTVRISDRRLLGAMADYSNIPAEKRDEAFIILDKMDKIGLEGVKEELGKNGFAEEARERFLSLFTEKEQGIEGIRALAEKLGTAADPAREDLEHIIRMVSAVKKADFRILFDPTLVRGMSYYTGTIFEIEMDEFGSSVAGGGRYDGMIGRFTGSDVPACGFSIGFERIITILMDRKFQIPGRAGRKAILVEKGAGEDVLKKAMAKAEELRGNGDTALVCRMAKNKKFQKESLAGRGYGEFIEFYKEG